jgi:hypothetical protein
MRKREPSLGLREDEAGRLVRLGGQAAVVALKNRAPIEDSVAVISRKLSVSLRPQFSITTFSLSEPDEPADAVCG